MPTMKVSFEDLADLEASVTFEVRCNNCGAGICGNVRVERELKGCTSTKLYIDPCEKCLEAARDGRG